MSDSVAPVLARRCRVSTAKGTTGEGAQQYRCKACGTYYNDLTGAVFENWKFPIEEMFYMVKEMRSVPE